MAEKKAQRPGTRARPRPAPVTRPSAGGFGAVDARWLAVLLAAAALLVYVPALHGDFLWDDDAHVTRPELRTLAGLWRIWFDFGATQQYYPLLHSAFWFEHSLWGNSVVGYHLVNVLLHAASGWIVYLILRRLAVPGAWLAAAIFVVHPVEVESIAWISEQKNTLSAALYLSSMYAYLAFDEERRRTQYVGATALFMLGLLTKTVVASLPGALLVIAWWRRGRIEWRRDVMPLVPWFALGAAAGLVTAWVERRVLGAEGADFALTAAQRVMLAGHIVLFYLGKLLWPSDLLFVYERWPAETWGTAQAWATLVMTAAVVACWAVRRWSRAPLAVALFFIGSLFPALGFVDVYPFVFSFVADHFQYLAGLGIIAAVAAVLTTGFARLGSMASRYSTLAGVGLVVALGVLTWRQSGLYRDPATLYSSTLDGNPGCYLCVNNLGMLALEAGQSDEAARRFSAAVRIKPDSAEAQGNLANALVETGAIAEGLEHYEHALRVAPNNVISRTNYGIALTRAGRLQDARAQFEAALKVMPGYAPARQNLSVLDSLGR
jgi:tetratricopeptide (TPR) repeat protein